MSRSVHLYALLLFAALVGSYLTWSHQPGADGDDDPLVADFTADEVVEIRYTAPEREVIAARRQTDEGRSYWWVESTRTGEQRAYRASRRLDRFFDDVAPWRASRKFPDPGERQREAFGFDDSTARLVVETEKRERTFTLGSRTHGGGLRYLHDDESGTYYAVDAGIPDVFAYADRRLRETRLIAGDEKDLVALQVEHAGRSIRLVRHGGDARTSAHWSTSGDPADESNRAARWVERLLGLQVVDYLEEGRPEGLDSRLVVEAELTDGRNSTLEIFTRRNDGETGYFARSDLTVEHVRLDRGAAGKLLAHLDSLLETSE